jgi:predicted nucleic acid-binding protein
VLMRWYRKNQLKKKGLRKVVRRLRRDIGSLSTRRPFTVLPIPEGSFKIAESILLQFASSNQIGANDSLHLAIAKCLQLSRPDSTIVTSDQPMKNVCGKEHIVFYDPEENAQ